MKKLVDHGLDGIEVYHHSANWFEKMRLRRFAKKNNLLITLGSDFHGIYYPNYYGLHINKDLAWIKKEMV